MMLDSSLQLTPGRKPRNWKRAATQFQQQAGQAPAHRIRRHWSVENELHWVLDMAFREDEARHRARHTAQNLSTLRHFALNLLKRFPDRKGVAGARKRAGWDHDYLLRVFTSEAA